MVGLAPIDKATLLSEEAIADVCSVQNRLRNCLLQGTRTVATIRS